MKICTMTCHHVYNYGATLQAYALQYYLESKGHNVEIIDYRLDSHRRYEWTYINPKRKAYRLCVKYPLFKWPICFYHNRSYLKTWGRKKRFDAFDKSFLKITQRTYRTIEELRQYPPVADLYVAGSDQIWNTDMPNGHMPAYYLDFGDKKTRRISYAASFGVPQIDDNSKVFVKEKIEALDSVSVREESGLSILHDLGIYDVNVVCDPVFLLSKKNWESIANRARQYNIKKDSYILVYDFMGDHAVENFAKKMARETTKIIVSINDHTPRSYADVNVNDAGPIEFLSLIMNAHCVISNSFHATAFSLIFEKDFYSFALKSQNTALRIKNILGMLKLTNRFEPDSSCEEIAYDKVNPLLTEYISCGKSFLKNNI